MNAGDSMTLARVGRPPIRALRLPLATLAGAPFFLVVAAAVWAFAGPALGWEWANTIGWDAGSKEHDTLLAQALLLLFPMAAAAMFAGPFVFVYIGRLRSWPAFVFGYAFYLLMLIPLTIEFSAVNGGFDRGDPDAPTFFLVMGQYGGLVALAGCWAATIMLARREARLSGA